METKYLVEKIKNDKKAFKITTADLAKKSGVPVGTLNKILSFKTSSIKMETFKKISSSLNELNACKENDGNNFNENFGFVKVAVATTEVRVADVSYNATKIKEAISFCDDKKVKLLVFPELSLTGATCGDLYFQETLLDSAIKGLKEIVKFSFDKEMIIFIGMPIKYLSNIYNVAVCVCKGEILGVTPKRSLTINERRYFSNNYDNVSEIVLFGKSCPFGENIIYTSNEMGNFTVSAELGEDLYFKVSPSTSHAENGANIIVNLSCDNEIVGRKEYRRTIIKAHSAKNNIAYLYANAGFGESTTDLVFSGHNIIAENGKILKESKLFDNDIIISDIDVDFISLEKCKNNKKFSCNPNYKRVNFSINFSKLKLDRSYDKMPFCPLNDVERLELILKMQATALQKRINHVKPKKLVIGLSGGLDSTLALLVAVRAMKAENRDLKDILTITMPCFGTTIRTKNNALALAESLGVSIKTVNIKNAVLAHFKDIEQDENLTDITYENSQARERTQVLMDIANKENGIVIGTGDLSELALGWATYNGDHMSMYGVNSSIPKTLVRFLVKYEAENSPKLLKETLLDVLDTPVSPELIPPKDNEIAQKTEDIVGPYLLHDFYIYYVLRCGFSPKKVYFIAKSVFKKEFSNEILYKWLKNFYYRFFNQQFKRSCVPDGVKIGSVGLSPRGDLLMPSDACKNEWLKELEEIVI